MFKKDKSSTEKSKSLLKNKEIRTLKSEIVKQFPVITEEQINSFIPNKAQVYQTKLLSRTIIYSVENVPFVFDLNGRNNFYPTLQLLWHCPTMLPTFVIHGPVSEFIMNGADLMAPGVCSTDGLQGLMEGSKACIRIVGNPLPFAVGDSLVCYSAISAPGRKKGKAMTVLHLFGDTLSGSVPPNSGFGQNVIYPIEDTPGYQLEDEDEDEEPKSNGTYADRLKQSGAAALSEEVEGKEEEEGEGSGDEGSDAAGDSWEELAPGETQQAEGEEEEEETDVDPTTDVPDKSAVASASPAQMDALLQTVLMLALKYIVKDQQLPMLASSFWAVLLRCVHHSHCFLLQIIPTTCCVYRCHAAARLVGGDAGEGQLEELDVRKSGFRKVSAFLTHYARLKLISVREQAGVISLVNVQRAHDLFRGVKTEDPDAFKAAVAAKSSSAAGSSSEQSEPVSEFAQTIMAKQQQAVAAATGSGTNKISVLELYKLPKQLRDVFGSVRGVHGEFLSAHEVRALHSSDSFGFD